jgi:hypothetical protein
MPDIAKVKGRSAESSPVAFRNVIAGDGETAQDAMLSVSLLTQRQTCPDAEGPAKRFVHANVSTVSAGIGSRSIKTIEDWPKLTIEFETLGWKLHIEDDVLEARFDVK